MCRPNASLSLKGSAPQLPPEIIWIIIKDLLVDLSAAACRGSEVITSYIPLNILALNRFLHKLVLATAYRTITLTSLDLLHRFSNVASNSPHLACLVHNLWIGTPRLGAFAVGCMSSIIATDHILSKAAMIKRLALPAPLFPLEFAKLGSTIEHVTVGGGEVPELPCKVKTVHIHGSIVCSWVHHLKRDTLRHVICDLKRPCKPGAIEHIIKQLLGDKIAKSDLRLEFVVVPGLSTWIEDELSQISTDGLSEGVLVVRVRHLVGDGVGLGNYTYCEEWAEAMGGT